MLGCTGTGQELREKKLVERDHLSLGQVLLALGLSFVLSSAEASRTLQLEGLAPVEAAL